LAAPAIPRRRESWPEIAAGAAAVVVGAAGFLKLMDFPAFLASLGQWRSVPPSFVAPLAVAVPTIEVVLSGTWLAGAHRGLVAKLLCVLLAVFTVAYVYEWASSGTPKCACLGVLNARLDFLAEAEIVIGSNIALMALLVPSVARLHRRCLPGNLPNAAAGTRGFTLVESVLVVGIVALVAALLMPNFASVRRSTRVSKTLSNLRQHMAIVSMYVGDYREQFPYLTDPHATFSVIRCESAGVAVRSSYFLGTAHYWHVGLADGYYNGQWRSPSFRSPLEPPEIVAGSYILSCTTVAAPEYYTPEERLEPPAQLRPVRMAEVVFPSLKGIITDGSCHRVNDGSYNRETVHFQAALADGAARAFRAAEHLGPQMHSGDGPYMRFGPHWPWFVPMTHTLHGVRGRDVR
jgi:hypothetical protein